MILLVKLAAGLAALYLLVVVLMALAQDWLLFPRWAAGSATDLLPASAERLGLELATGEELVGVHIRAERSPPAQSALLLGFGGNAWNAEGLANYLHSVFPDREVVAFHYRGYAPSTGRPSGRALLQDALAIHDHLLAVLAPKQIVAVGLSIGAGPAAHLASQRPIAGLPLSGKRPLKSGPAACRRPRTAGDIVPDGNDVPQPSIQPSSAQLSYARSPGQSHNVARGLPA